LATKRLTSSFLDSVLGLEQRDGVTDFDPGIETSGERAHATYAAPSEHQRHPGAGSLVGSGAVENDISISRNVGMAFVEIDRRDQSRAGNVMRI
jgi:hypothetical protein